MQAWPKFKAIFDANLESLKVLQGSALASLKNKSNTLAPTVLTTRFANYVVGLNTLNEGYNDEILIACLRRLRAEMDRILVEVAETLKGGNSSSRFVFLINNYKMIVVTLETAQ